MKKNWMLRIATLLTALLLAACGGGGDEAAPNNGTDTETGQNTEQTEKEENDGGHGDHSNMNHSGTGELPEGIQEAQNPAYEVGSKAIIEEGHMSGMKGAEATIVGAYATTVYAVSYDPTNGGERVENHKWVVHEEIQDAGDQPFEPGQEVVLEADHMEGMKGATAEIDTAEQTTVYMIDFTPTDGSEPVTNHQWVTEDELSPAE
nr:YdhK family protein [Mesobacillus campisalis]